LVACEWLQMMGLDAERGAAHERSSKYDGTNAGDETHESPSHIAYEFVQV